MTISRGLIAVTLLFMLVSLLTLLSARDKDAVAGITSHIPTPAASFAFHHPFLFSPELQAITVSSASSEPFIWSTAVSLIGQDQSVLQTLEIPGAVRNAYLFDVAWREPEELIVLTQAGQLVRTRIFHYDQERQELVPMTFVRADGERRDHLCCSSPIFQPRENGVQYDLAMRQPQYDSETYQAIGEKIITYSYDGENHEFEAVDTRYREYPRGG